MWSGLYGLPLRLARDARRLDSSPVWFAQRGAAVSLSWLAGLDLAAVREHCVRLADATLAGLGLYPRDSAIISLDLTTRPHGDSSGPAPRSARGLTVPDCHFTSTTRSTMLTWY
jgi:hypothetical protein